MIHHEGKQAQIWQCYEPRHLYHSAILSYSLPEAFWKRALLSEKHMYTRPPSTCSPATTANRRLQECLVSKMYPDPAF